MATPQPDTAISARGKLLLTGEYFVLDGALALALPTRPGQVLRVFREAPDGRLRWRSFDEEERCWFEGLFSLETLTATQTSDAGIADRLTRLMQAIRKHRPGFWRRFAGGRIETTLEFPRAWGLGTSSTLIAALARWSEVDPHALLAETFGGSGYDLACAFADGPILYQRRAEGPQYVRFPFEPVFRDQLFFVYLEQKQDSRAAIARYREKVADGRAQVAQVSRLTARLLQAADLPAFEAVLREHEALVSAVLGTPPVQERLFPDYRGVVKSLGAWGGDFVLAASRQPAEATRRYFIEKGYPVVLAYRDLIR